MARCAPPLHPPGWWHFQGVEPISEPADRIAGQTLAGDFALPAPIDQWAIAPLETTRTVWPLHHQTGERSCFPQYPHDHFMETRKGAFALPFLGTYPSTKEPSCPLEPGPTLRGLDAAIFAQMNHANLSQVEGASSRIILPVWIIPYLVFLRVQTAIQVAKVSKKLGSPST